MKPLDIYMGILAFFTGMGLASLIGFWALPAAVPIGFALTFLWRYLQDRGY